MVNSHWKESNKRVGGYKYCPFYVLMNNVWLTKMKKAILLLARVKENIEIFLGGEEVKKKKKKRQIRKRRNRKEDKVKEQCQIK